VRLHAKTKTVEYLHIGEKFVKKVLIFEKQKRKIKLKRVRNQT